MKFGFLIKVGLVIASWAAVGHVMAITCDDYLPSRQPINGNMPLQTSTLVVGHDVPIGTILYRQTMLIGAKAGDQWGAAVKCVLPQRLGNYFSLLDLNTDASISTVNWNGGKYSSVYKTNILGLGFTFALRAGTGAAKGSCMLGYCNANLGIPEVEMALVKIGDVNSGVLNGSELPRLIAISNVTIISSRLTRNFRFLAAEMGFSGHIKIDVNSYKKSDGGSERDHYSESKLNRG